MMKQFSITFLAIFAFFNLIGQSAIAGPEANPKTFRGTYTFSAYANSSTADKIVNQSYQGKIKIDAAGKVSGRILRTIGTHTSDGISNEKRSRVTMTGKITKVTNSSHGGYKVLKAATKIKFSDGTTGTLSIFNPYTVKPSQISGYGTIKVAKLSGGASLQKQ